LPSGAERGRNCLFGRLNEPPQVLLCGRLYDRVVEDEGALRFAEHFCVPDARLVPTSLVFPI